MHFQDAGLEPSVHMIVYVDRRTDAIDEGADIDVKFIVSVGADEQTPRLLGIPSGDPPHHDGRLPTKCFAKRAASA